GSGGRRALAQERLEVDRDGGPRVCLADALEVAQRVVVVVRGLRGDAVARHEQVEVAHVGVMRGKEDAEVARDAREHETTDAEVREQHLQGRGDRKSTRLNSSHVKISYAVFCLKKKKKTER